MVIRTPHWQSPRPLLDELPDEPHTIACNAGYGSGGLGRHLQEMVDFVRAQGRLEAYHSTQVAPDDAKGVVIGEASLPLYFRYTPLRWNRALALRWEVERFDRAVAGRLRPAGGIFIGFGGQSLQSFAKARALGWKRVGMISGSSHIDNVRRRHAAALSSYPVEPGWADDRLAAKTRAEYAEADVIYANSEYTRQSFLDAGIPASKLQRLYFSPHPRYVPAASRLDDGVFRVVFVGTVTVMKGVPWLIEAFRRAAPKRSELILVGGWGSRGMKRYMLRQMQLDSRIHVRPGDPLPELQRASICVHPSFEDGFGYGPLEAMACGVPVIVTEDTGMKECLTEGLNGSVVPTGDVDALAERLASYARSNSAMGAK